MTFKEIHYLHKQINIDRAIELDTRLRLAGSKEGNVELKRLLNEDKMEEVKKLNTNEATKENRDIFSAITSHINKKDR